MPASPSSPAPRGDVSAPRVAHLLRPAQGGMRELVRALLKRGADPLLLAPPDTLESLADAVPDAARRHVLRAENPSPQNQLLAGQAAGVWAKRSGAQVLHGHGLRFAPLFAAASVASGLPLVVSLHNLVPPDLAGMAKTAAGAALGRASFVIAVSGAVAQSARGIVSAPRLVTIPNGIDGERFAAGDEERAARRTEARRALGVGENTPVAVCLSRLSPEKGVADLLEAWALLMPLVPDARLFVAGAGRLRKTLDYHIELLGIADGATLLGAWERERIPDLLFAADVFAIASREEGLSLAVLEAMAAGVSVVATAVGGLPEAVGDGETGLLVSPRDGRLFAGALQTMIIDPAKRAAFGVAGRQRVAERFTENAMVAATFALYRRAVAGR